MVTSCGTITFEMSCDLVDILCTGQNLSLNFTGFVSDNANGDAANDWIQHLELGARLFSAEVLTNYSRFQVIYMANHSSSLSIFLFLSVLFGFQIAAGPAMSYEEPKYTVVSETDTYEVRRYKNRTVAEVTSESDNSGFRILFDYISGANLGSRKLEMTVPVTQSEKIAMTIPVTQSNTNGKMIMRFFLPDQYSAKNAPKPTDRRVRIIDLPEQYFGVISYSGFASDSNFEKHHEELRMVLLNDGLVITGPPVKATYNSPFTPPFLRRNEAMYPLEWN